MIIDKVEAAKGLITILLCLILVTPLCGVLFHCGCTWPWAGLAKDCNYFASQTLVQCPWCKSMLAGGLSVSLSIGAAFLTSVSDLYLTSFQVNKTTSIVMCISCALAVFLLVAVVTAWLAANSQGYPHFIFKS